MMRRRTHKKTNKNDMVLVAGVRTAFCKAGTNLESVPVQELGRVVVRELLDRLNLDPRQVDELIFGCVGQPVDAANVARVIALQAGLPESVPAATVHRNCATGFEALTTAYERMCAGRGDVFIVGGAESMSRYPLLAPRSLAKKLVRLGRARSLWQKLGVIGSLRPRDFAPRWALMEGLADPVSGLNMGQTAERVAREFGISREQQDRFSLTSHQRAAAAQARGRFEQETTPVYVPPTYKSVIEHDNGIRAQQSLEALARLRPAFEKHKTGTVTAGSASQLTDGAVALLVMREAKAEALGLPRLARIRSYAYRGCDPARMGLGPAYAIPEVLAAAGMSLNEIGVVEINEAFAAQVLACFKALDSARFAREKLGLSQAVGALDPERTNVNGGAIALGHPLAATGARLILTTALEMNRRGEPLGLAALCVGGGQGAAVLLEAA